MPNNNNVFCHYSLWAITWSQLCMTKKWQWQKNAPPLLAILLAMTMPWCNSECIAQCGRSRANPDANGCCHQASNCPVLSRQTPWSSIWCEKLTCGIKKSLSKASIQKAQSRPSTQIIKGTMPQLELKSSAVLLAIKCYPLTKFDEIIGLQWNLIKSGRSWLSIAVKLLSWMTLDSKNLQF